MKELAQELMMLNGVQAVVPCVDSLSYREREDLTEQLEAIAARAVFLSGYIDGRGGSGYADKGHFCAAGRAKAWMLEVLRVVGYESPECVSVIAGEPLPAMTSDNRKAVR